MGKIKKTVKTYIDDYVGCDKVGYNRLIRECDYVSFDIFDTLVTRDVETPKDLFRLIEKKVNIPDFYNKRIKAESDARYKIGKEVSLREIYECFEGLTLRKIDELCQKELEEEINVCRANYRMINLYRKCLKNKKVILISDMYLGKEMISKILDKCGITGYDKLYISCEYRLSKRNGDLYKFILRDLAIDPSKIIHIGNDFMSDIIMSRVEGIRSIKIKTKNNNLIVGVPLKRSITKKEQLPQIISYINNSTLSSRKFKDFYYRFGYETFGILLLGFSKWLIDGMEKNGIEQVLFLARDGYILKKAYDNMGLYRRIPSRYFEISRRSIRVPSSFSKQQTYENTLKLMNVPSRISINQILDCWGLDPEEFKLEIEKSNINNNEVFWSKKLKNDSRVRKLYFLVKDKIIKNANEEKETLIEYLKKYDFQKKTAIVDIGYGANIQKELQRALKENGFRNDIIGYYLFLDYRAGENIEDLDLKAYGYVWDNYNSHEDVLYEEQPFVGLVESLFLEQNGSTKRYVWDGNDVIAERYKYEYLSEGGEVDEIDCIKRVQDGALDFIKQAKTSCISNLKIITGNNSFYLLRYGIIRPSLNILKHFYNFRFFNANESSFLAKPKKTRLNYLLHLKQLKQDFYASAWKIGFFKSIFLIDMSYETLWKILKVFFPTERV